MNEEKEILNDENITEDIKKEEEKSNTGFISESDKQEIISDFTPEPINIPKYDIEKEHAKHNKNKERAKKRKNKKNTKAYKVLMKTLSVVRNVLIVMVLFAIVSSALASVIIRVNTSEYAIESSVRSNNPETFTIGKIKDPASLNMKRSSQRAAITDILRDNSLYTTTYEDIVSVVRKSSYSKLIAKNAHGVIASLLYGETYEGIKGEDVTETLLENVSYIKLVTGVELGQSACENFGAYVEKSPALKEIKETNLRKLPIAKYTEFTKVALSLPVLIGLLLLIAILVVLTVYVCSGYAHKIIGWTTVLSGVVVGALGFLCKPTFSAKNEFINCVADAVMKGFSFSSLIYGGIVALVGVLVLLIGRALAYDDEYED